MRWCAALAATLAVLAIQAPGPAMATNWGSVCASGSPPACVSLANNSTHVARYYNYGTGTNTSEIPYLADATTWVLGNVYNPTDMTAYRNESDAYPDIRMYDWYNSLNPSLIGWAYCPPDNTGVGGTHPNRWCRGQSIQFNSYLYHNSNGYFDNDQQRRSQACHEIGHSVGARHRATDVTCMYSFGGPGTNNLPTLDGHDVAHINVQY